MSHRRSAVRSAWTIAMLATLASWHADAAQRTFVGSDVTILVNLQPLGAT